MLPGEGGCAQRECVRVEVCVCVCVCVWTVDLRRRQLGCNGWHRVGCLLHPARYPQGPPVGVDNPGEVVDEGRQENAGGRVLDA